MNRPILNVLLLLALSTLPSATARPHPHLNIQGPVANAPAAIQRVDNEHGNVLPEYAKIGKPDYPTPKQVEQLNRAITLPPPEETHRENHQLTLKLAQRSGPRHITSR